MPLIDLLWILSYTALQVSSVFSVQLEHSFHSKNVLLFMDFCLRVYQDIFCANCSL